MSSKAVNVAVIGWGNFFSHIHEQTLADLIGEGRCNLRAVCVRSEQTRAQIAQRLPFEYGTPEYRKVLEDPRIDAVLIGAPHSIQAQLSIDALKAGKWVYVEKPMFADQADTGTDPADFYRQFQALDPLASQRLAVGLNKRFAPAYRQVRDLADHWDGLKSIQMTIIDDAWRWGSKYPPGFLMWLDACHWLDLARWFTGSEVVQISCLSAQVEDSLVTLKMANGALAVVLLSGNGTMDMMKEELRVTSGRRICATATDYVQLEIFGQPKRHVQSYQANLQSGGDLRHIRAINEGGLEAFRAIRRQMFDLFNRLQTAPNAQQEDYLKKNIPNFMRPQGWRQSVIEFVDSVAAGSPLRNSATYHDAYVAYLLVEAAKQSAAAGGTFVAPAAP